MTDIINETMNLVKNLEGAGYTSEAEQLQKNARVAGLPTEILLSIKECLEWLEGSVKDQEILAKIGIIKESINLSLRKSGFFPFR